MRGRVLQHLLGETVELVHARGATDRADDARVGARHAVAPGEHDDRNRRKPVFRNFGQAALVDDPEIRNARGPWISANAGNSSGVTSA